MGPACIQSRRSLKQMSNGDFQNMGIAHQGPKEKAKTQSASAQAIRQWVGAWCVFFGQPSEPVRMFLPSPSWCTSRLLCQCSCCSDKPVHSVPLCFLLQTSFDNVDKDTFQNSRADVNPYERLGVCFWLFRCRVCVGVPTTTL